MEEKSEFVPLWHRKEPQKKEMPSRAVALYKDAKVNECWIYHISKKKFYTPDEFADQWDDFYKDPSQSLILFQVLI